MKENMDAKLPSTIESFVQKFVGEGKIKIGETGCCYYSAPGDLGDNFARIYGNFSKGELGIEIYAPSETFNVAVVADKTGFRAVVHVRKDQIDNNTFIYFADDKAFIYGNEKFELAAEVKDSIWHVNVESLSQIDILPDDAKKVGSTLEERLDYIESMAFALKESEKPKRS